MVFTLYSQKEKEMTVYIYELIYLKIVRITIR